MRQGEIFGKRKDGERWAKVYQQLFIQRTMNLSMKIF